MTRHHTRALRTPLLALATLVLSASFHASAQASEALAKSKACLACHAKDEKVLGPSFVEIQKKYASNKEAVKLLGTSIRAGSVDKWGKVAMPPNPQLSEDDAKALATWIMQLK
jgi:cytochrome c